jgi:hypothetical protein
VTTDIHARTLGERMHEPCSAVQALAFKAAQFDDDNQRPHDPRRTIDRATVALLVAEAEWLARRIRTGLGGA